MWFTAYPLSLITRPGESFLAALGDEALWEAFRRSASTPCTPGRSSGPAASPAGAHTPSVDGHFDRISIEIDPEFGTEDEFRAMCAMATEYGGTIIDDIVPGHTGKGADFRLAEMKYARLPRHLPHDRDRAGGLGLLPDVPAGRDSVNLDATTEERLEKAGYIIGRLQRVIFYAEGVKETNWSATAPVVGADGVKRRWVYLHYFKEGQPSINWLDPSFAGMRLVIGDALHSLADLGLRRAAAGRQRLPRRREERRGHAGVVGGPPAVRGGQPLHRQHGAQGRRVHLPGAEPDDRRHQDDRPRPAPTCPTTSSTAPRTTTRWPPATPSSCG